MKHFGGAACLCNLYNLIVQFVQLRHSGPYLSNDSALKNIMMSACGTSQATCTSLSRNELVESPRNCPSTSFKDKSNCYVKRLLTVTENHAMFTTFCKRNECAIINKLQ